MSIKITRPLVEIPVNGNDYKIKIDLNNQTFIENFINLYEFSTKNKPDFQNSDEPPLDKMKKLFKYNKEIVKLIDKTFGEGSVLKIFGIECPTEDLIMDFLIQIEPFVNQAVEMKIENIKRQENAYEKRAILRENLR